MSSSGSVNGVDLTVTNVWFGRPRVFHDGAELPRDRWGNYKLRDSQGRVSKLEVSYSWWELRPRLRAGEETVLLGRHLPVWLRVAVLIFVAVGVSGGAIGATLAVTSAAGSLVLLRRSDRRPQHILAALALPVLAIVVYGLLGVLVSRTR